MKSICKYFSLFQQMEHPGPREEPLVHPGAVVHLVITTLEPLQPELWCQALLVIVVFYQYLKRVLCQAYRRFPKWGFEKITFM